MRVFPMFIMLIILLCSLFGCANRGVIKDTATETESESQTMTEKETEKESMTESESMTQSETDPLTGSESETVVESETSTEDSLFSDFFGKTREEIMKMRGDGDVSTEGDASSEKDNSLHYSDRYAGFSGSSRYSFDEEENLGEITLSFDEGFTLEEIAEAVTKLNAEAVTQNNVTVWTEGDFTFRLAEEDGRPILTVKKSDAQN